MDVMWCIRFLFTPDFSAKPGQKVSSISALAGHLKPDDLSRIQEDNFCVIFVKRKAARRLRGLGNEG